MSERDRLDELGAELPWDRPDDERRASVRSSLLTAAAETSRRRSVGRWFVVGGAFACGAAAAVLAVALWPQAARDDGQLARVQASPATRLEDTVTRTATGSDETVRVHGGRVRLAVGELRRGDRVRVATGDAVVEGVGSYEVSVANDALSEVTVQAGTAQVHVSGHQAVFLAAGQTWRASVVTADLEPAKPDGARTPATSAATSNASSSYTTPPNTTASNTTSSNATTSNAGSSNAAAPSATSSNATTSRVATISPNTTSSTTTSQGTTNPATSRVAMTSQTTASNATTSRVAPNSPNTGVPSPSSTIDKRDLPPGDSPKTADISIGTPPPLSSSARTKSVTEQHLQDGWALLRAGKASEAAAELGKAADGDGDLAADARYFQAVALIRAGRTVDAERALVGFLDHAPKSIRRGRASVMLARLFAARGDGTSARAWFESALEDHDPSVVAAARDGLTALRGN
jgi:hypothetical protein